MTEETRESYDSGEVVWVKLGSSWWPGEVKNAEELPSEVLDFKKAPLVIVKFFDEDSYEYVKTWTNIYPYNCEKKNEFIKKGMAAYRAKIPHMEKFPKDVLKAEEKVGGNPNILSNPIFLPEKKRNYAAEIFGTPSPKNTTAKNKKRSSANKSSSKKDTSHITHRRFLGVDDYRAYICIQYPGKDRIPGDREDEEVIRINRELEQDFNCHSCSFSTKRLEVMILHTKSHIQGVYLASARKNKQTIRRRKEKSKKSRSSDMVESDTSTSDSEPMRQKKRKPKSQGTKKSKIKKTEEEPPKKDIRSELLEAWEDSDDEDMDFDLDKTKESETIDSSLVPELTVDDSLKKSDVNDTLDRTDRPDQSDSTLTETADETSSRPKHTDRSSVDEPKSPTQTIEEVLNNVSGETDEPNAQNELVKPVEEHLSTEKLLSTLEDDSTDVDDKIDKTTDEKKEETGEADKNDEKDVTSQKSDGDVDEDVSLQKMDRDMHEAIKSCFDFDEDDEDDTIVSKATSGRKIPRVIPKVERKKSSSEIPEPEPAKDEQEDMSSAFKELMEITSVPDLPDVQNTLKCEQNFHNIKTIKFPDKPEQAGSPPKPERKDSTEVATKLTNPKKRFVKSFEDFELLQNEIRRREEEQLETSKNEKYDSGFDYEEPKTEVSGSSSKDNYLDNSDEQDSPESNIQLSKLKSKIMSKIIEEAKINDESKNKIMSKIKEPKPRHVETDKKPITADSETKPSANSFEKSKTETVFGSHRTPRSKILESYRKDVVKHKAEQKSETALPEAPKINDAPEEIQYRLRDSQKDKDVVPPKKNKWSRRGSHPKKDRNLFLLQEPTPQIPVTADMEKPTVEEPTNSKNQAQVDLASIDDSSKINDIILGEIRPETPKDIPILEQEEVQTTVKEPESVEPQLTELVPVQFNENDLVLNKEEVIEESQMLVNDEVAEVLPPICSEVAEIKETIRETEPPVEKKEISEEIVEVSQNEIAEVTKNPIVEFPKDEIVEAPRNEIVNLPQNEIVEDSQNDIVDVSQNEIDKDLQNEIVDVPQNEIVDVSQNEIVNVPQNEIIDVPQNEIVEVSPNDTVEGLQNEIVEVPRNPIIEFPEDQIGEVPKNEIVEVAQNEIVEVPPKEIIEVSQNEIVEVSHHEIVEDVPHEIVKEVSCEIVEEVSYETVKDPEIEIPRHETVKVPHEIINVPQNEIVEEPNVEELPQRVEDKTLEKVEEEIKSIVEEVADSTPQEAPSIVEQSPIKDISSENTDETFIVPSKETETVIDEKVDSKEFPITEEHIEVEDSLVVPPIIESSPMLPYDAIIIPPKKNKKRKMSKAKVPSSAKSAEAESQPEDFAPLEKRIKEVEDVEEEKKVAPPVLENFEDVKVASDVTLENEEVKDESRSNEGDKEKIMETEQVVEVEEINKTYKGDKDVAEFEKYDEEVKVDNELVDIAESTPIVEDTPVSTPIVEDIPESTPIVEDIPESTPIVEDIPESTPIVEDIPESTPIVENIPESTPIVEDIPESTPVIEDVPESTPTIVNIPQMTPISKHKEKAETVSKNAEPETVEERSKEIETQKDSDSLDKDDDHDHHNEVEIQCASSSVESFKFSIQTNLSILSSREEMSALALATLSEIKADLESNEDMMHKEKEEETEPERTIVPPVLLESEMVPIEGNLTVVSEKDLADGQVEITSEQVISPKRPVTLSNFSMDFSDSFSDSNSNSTTDTSSDLGRGDFNSKGTEFTAKALTKQMKKLDHKKESRYGRLELINILEGNSDTEKKPKEYTHPPKKTSMVDDICDFEEHIPSQIVCAKNLKKDIAADLEQDFKDFKEKEKTSKTSVKSTTSKLLERLTTESKAKASAAKGLITSELPLPERMGKITIKTQHVTPKTTKNLSKSKSSKPIILSEQIVKPAMETPKLKQRKPLEDFEDVETFVIHKDPNKSNLDEEEPIKIKPVSTKTTGKAKILQQTIITPAGEIIQPTVSEPQTDDNIFDINSMPIVLSDEILTPESIEKMPIVIGSDTKVTIPEKVVKRPAPSRIVTTVATQVTPNKTVTITKHKPPRILQTFSNRVVKNSPLLPNTAKPGKYIIVPQSSIPPTKYITKKPAAVKKPTVSPGVVQKVPNIAPEPSGNKIMIVTNQQGQQQRLLLTPAQQKMLGYQNQKVTKTIVKGNVMQKSVLAKGTPLGEASTSGVVSKTPTLIGQKVVMGPSGQGLITSTSHQIIGVQGRTTKTVTKRPPGSTQKLSSSAGKPQKTILIKNQHGQTVKKIQGTDDELLDKQVAEQLKAIKASSGMKFGSQQKPAEIEKATPKAQTRRSYSKRMEVKPRGPPPLSGLHHSPKQETVVSMPTTAAMKKAEATEAKPTNLVAEENKAQQTERPLNQLVIQDAVGNQTTITEGQILALPSETVDGQPQSYMLVTLDESGNLTPLNSEALMSLDPNLGLGGDLSNMVLQFDQSALSDQPQAAIIKPPEPAKPVEAEPTPQTVVPVPEPSVTTEITETVPEQKIVPSTEAVPQVTASTNGDSGQQLIVTGDPIATQKFLESLTEGTTDLANILANAEGNSILIQADGQQILINTNTDNQMLLSMNNDSANVTENTEGGGNPIFSTQPSKNQDILAAALADTDVFQQEHPSSTQSKIVSQLSPNNALYPMNVGNVLETSLTLSSPIMTPLEVPSTNNKKIPDDEADILTQVPKNVDLPITITDPNISQTVANQQVSQMIANELQTNLELALPISETTISAVSTEMNSPSYVYSLPTLDDSVEMTQKPFNGSMPLLNEDVVEEKTGEKSKTDDRDKNKPETGPEGFLAEEEGRFTLGGEMCSSLSEPPPEMFDLPEVNEKGVPGNVPSLQSTPDASDNASKDGDTTDLSQAESSNEGSCEIPLQPRIVTKSAELARNLDSLKRSLGEAADGDEGENKKCKFD